MRMSSIMRWRSGLITSLGVVMARLLLSNEADRLINQHRKPSGFPRKNHHVQTEYIPRERFSPATLNGPIHFSIAVIQELDERSPLQLRKNPTLHPPPQ